MKKNKMLVPKILIFILLFMIIGIGLLKFIDYLERPTDNFFGALDEISNSAKNMSQILDNNLYNLFPNKAEINIDTNIATNNFSNTEYSEYADFLQTSSFITSMQYDKTQNYLYSKTKVLKNNHTYDLEYVENAHDRYIKEQDNSFEKINMESFNFKAFNVGVYGKIIDKCYDLLKTQIINPEIKLLTNDVIIDNNTYEAEISSITIPGSDVLNLLKNLSTSITNDKEINAYLEKMYGMSTDTDTLLNEIIEKYQIKRDSTYLLNIYRNASNKKVIKFTFGEYAKKSLLSYEFVNSYNLLKLDDKTYTIIGQKDNFTLIINAEKTATFTFKDSEGVLNGTLKVGNDESEEFHLEYNLDKEKSSQASTSIALIIKYYPDNIKKDMMVELNSAVLIKEQSDVTKKDIVSNNINTNSTTKAYIDTYLKNAYNYLKPQVEESTEE